MRVQAVPWHWNSRVAFRWGPVEVDWHVCFLALDSEMVNESDLGLVIGKLFYLTGIALRGCLGQKSVARGSRSMGIVSS